MRRRAVGLIGAGILPGAIALSLTACGRGAPAKSDSTFVVTGARTAVAQVIPMTETLKALGAVTASPGHVAALSAPVPARVARIYVAVGHHVVPGQPLVELEQSSIQAAAASANSRLSAANSALERARRLAQAGIIPRKDVEQAAAAAAQARADAVAARRSAQLSILRSPIRGVVTSLNATLGSMADAVLPIVEVTDPSVLDIVLNVTPTEAAKVRIGMPVILRAGGEVGGELLGSGRVSEIAGTVDPMSRGVAIRVRAPATRRELRIGETVYGEIAIAVRSGVTVPIAALVPKGEGSIVFVVDRTGIARSRPVQIGVRMNQLAEVVSGLASGERVVTEGAYGIDDGARIAPRGSAPR